MRGSADTVFRMPAIPIKTHTIRKDAVNGVPVSTTFTIIFESLKKIFHQNQLQHEAKVNLNL